MDSYCGDMVLHLQSLIDLTVQWEIIKIGSLSTEQKLELNEIRKKLGSFVYLFDNNKILTREQIFELEKMCDKLTSQLKSQTCSASEGRFEDNSLKSKLVFQTLSSYDKPEDIHDLKPSQLEHYKKQINVEETSSHLLLSASPQRFEDNFAKSETLSQSLPPYDKYQGIQDLKTDQLKDYKKQIYIRKTSLHLHSAPLPSLEDNFGKSELLSQPLPSCDKNKDIQGMKTDQLEDYQKETYMEETPSHPVRSASDQSFEDNFEKSKLLSQLLSYDKYQITQDLKTDQLEDYQKQTYMGETPSHPLHSASMQSFEDNFEKSNLLSQLLSYDKYQVTQDLKTDQLEDYQTQTYMGETPSHQLRSASVQSFEDNFEKSKLLLQLLSYDKYQVTQDLKTDQLEDYQKQTYMGETPSHPLRSASVKSFEDNFEKSILLSQLLSYGKYQDLKTGQIEDYKNQTYMGKTPSHLLFSDPLRSCEDNFESSKLLCQSLPSYAKGQGTQDLKTDQLQDYKKQTYIRKILRLHSAPLRSSEENFGKSKLSTQSSPCDKHKDTQDLKTCQLEDYKKETYLEETPSHPLHSALFQSFEDNFEKNKLLSHLQPSYDKCKCTQDLKTDQLKDYKKQTYMGKTPSYPSLSSPLRSCEDNFEKSNFLSQSLPLHNEHKDTQEQTLMGKTPSYPLPFLSSPLRSCEDNFEKSNLLSQSLPLYDEHKDTQDLKTGQIEDLYLKHKNIQDLKTRQLEDYKKQTFMGETPSHPLLSASFHSFEGNFVKSRLLSKSLLSCDKHQGTQYLKTDQLKDYKKQTYMGETPSQLLLSASLRSCEKDFEKLKLLSQSRLLYEKYQDTQDLKTGQLEGNKKQTYVDETLPNLSSSSLRSVEDNSVKSRYSSTSTTSFISYEDSRHLTPTYEDESDPFHVASSSSEDLYFSETEEDSVDSVSSFNKSVFVSQSPKATFRSSGISKRVWEQSSQYLNSTLDYFDNFSDDVVVDWLKVYYDLWIDFLVHKNRKIAEFDNYLAEHNAREERIRIYSDLHKNNEKVKNITESSSVNQIDDVSVQLHDIETQCSPCSSEISVKEQLQSRATVSQFQSLSEVSLILSELKETITEFQIKVTDGNKTIQKKLDNIEQINLKYKSLEHDMKDLENVAKDFKRYYNEVSENIRHFCKYFNTVPCSSNEKVKAITFNENLLMDIKNVVKDAVAEAGEKIKDLTFNESLSNDIKNIVRKAIAESPMSDCLRF